MAMAKMLNSKLQTAVHKPLGDTTVTRSTITVYVQDHMLGQSDLRPYSLDSWCIPQEHWEKSYWINKSNNGLK